MPFDPRAAARIAADRHLSQRQIAARYGCRQPFIARLLSGRYSPSVETVERLAAALGCGTTDLIRPTVAAPPPRK